MCKKPTILIIISAYLPGFKAGGPLRSIVNLVDLLSDEFEFLVITSDRDLGDSHPYPNISRNTWQRFGNANIYYCKPSQMSFKGLSQIICNTPHDILYLNSIFSLKTSVTPLLLRRLNKIPYRPIILAPRGQFSEGAIQIKPIRKRLFIIFGKFLGLWKNVNWQASSEYELQDISRVLKPPNKDITIACNLPSQTYNNNVGWHDFTSPLKLVFLSRISPKKNLHFALECLRKVIYPATFSIFGPAEDEEYWRYCRKLASTLPENVKVYWKGAISPEDVPSIMTDHHLFFFPTLGENYGHVIAEAISSGIPILISDTTPWRNLSKYGIGHDFPLNDQQAFADYINWLSQISVDEYNILRGNVATYAKKQQSLESDIEANKRLFRNTLKQRHKEGS